VSLKRWAAKRDKSEKEIIQLFELHGCWVAPLSEKGLPDLLICCHGLHGMVEIKAGYSAKLTLAQGKHFRETVPAHNLPHYVVAQPADVPAILSQLRRHYASLSPGSRSNP